jgi:hypothetical protein
MKKSRPHNSKFLTLTVPSPIRSPSAAAMLRARFRAKISQSQVGTNLNRSSRYYYTRRTCQPKTFGHASSTPMEDYKFARLYSAFGTPPPFDLSRIQLRRREATRGCWIYTSTPLVGKPNRFFHCSGQREGRNSCGERKSKGGRRLHWVLKHSRERLEGKEQRV